MSTTTTIDVDDVATDEDVRNHEGLTEDRFLDLLPEGVTDAETFRQSALERTMKILKRRVPPLSDASIGLPVELRDAVIFGTLERIYFSAMTTAEDGNVFRAKWEHYKGEFNEEVAAMKVTISGEVAAPTGGSIVTSRR